MRNTLYSAFIAHLYGASLCDLLFMAHQQHASALLFSNYYIAAFCSTPVQYL